VLKNGFLETAGVRPLSQGIRRVLIVLTDGRSSDSVSLPAENVKNCENWWFHLYQMAGKSVRSNKIFEGFTWSVTSHCTSHNLNKSWWKLFYKTSICSQFPFLGFAIKVWLFYYYLTHAVLFVNVITWNFLCCFDPKLVSPIREQNVPKYVVAQLLRSIFLTNDS